MRIPLVLLLLTSLALVACAGDAAEGEGEGEGEGEEIGDGEAGDVCTFNADCGAGLRCGCEDGLCACEVGARGTGVNGVDVCVDENDCASAVCAEDADDTFTCSGPCSDDSDCEARLPVCADIAFIGQICIRDTEA